jgi:hypothetical protein
MSDERELDVWVVREITSTQCDEIGLINTKFVAIGKALGF